MLVGKAGAYPSEATSGATLKDRLLASPTNIRLGCKGLPETNTLIFLVKLINFNQGIFCG